MPHSSNTTRYTGQAIEQNQDIANREELRFQEFYDNIIGIHDVVEKLDNIQIRRRLRELVNKIEDNFAGCPEFTIPRGAMYRELRLGLVGGSLSGKSSLVHHYLTGVNPKEEVLSGRHKKAVKVDGKDYLMLIRDETGPPDSQFSQWADAVMLVFSLVDELSFNVISSYYAKMIQYRSKENLPIVLVSINDGVSEDMQAAISNARIKKFIIEHDNCPYFNASLATGVQIFEVFQSAAETMVRTNNSPTILQANDHRLQSPGFTLPTALYDSLSTPSSLYGSTLSVSSQSSLKKHKRRTALFSKNESKKDDIPDDIGSGRAIPIKQGYLHKRSHKSLREWRKKYVTLNEDCTLAYYPSMKDYIDENSAKRVSLVTSTVKLPGRRPPRASVSHGPITPRPTSLDLANGDSTKKQALTRHVSLHHSTTQPPSTPNQLNAYVISNSLTMESLVSPTHLEANRLPSPGLKTTAGNFEVQPSKRKHKRHGGRHAKSCEIDYVGTSLSDIENNTVSTTPAATRKRFSHRRQKSSGGPIKDLSVLDKGTDTEDDDFIFSVVSLDGRTWDFEAQSQGERDVWAKLIETSICKALQNGMATKERTMSESSVQSPTIQCFKSQLQSIPGNDRCADCGTQDPTWASLNLGILVCIECSGVHRNLGTHLSRVRSVDLDDWPPECLAVMSNIGNKFANEVWEDRVDPERALSSTATREEREQWIHRKYEHKEFLSSINEDITLGEQLIEAVRFEDSRLCYRVLAHCSPRDVNSVSRDEVPLTPLQIACSSGNIPISQMLLWCGASAGTPDANGHTAMHFAHKAQSKQCIEILSQFGCPEDTPC